MSSKKKLEEKHLQTLKSMQQNEFNKKCFECDQRGPTYVDVTIGSFVCTSCGGILRGLNPPHRIKSVSMATFSPTEISFMESRGNEYCKNIYLGKHDATSKPRPDSKDHAKLKYFMEQKYEQKRWYVPPDQAQKSNQSVVKPEATNSLTFETTKPLTSLLGNNVPQIQVKNSSNPPKVDNILADFSSTPAVSDSHSSLSNSGFADFGNAFGTQNFDTFGDFTSGTASAGNATTASGFADFSSFVSPSTAAPAVSQPSQTVTADKYADLSDLFSTDNTTTPSAGIWSGGNNMSAFGASSSPHDVNRIKTTSQTQGSIFGSPQQQSVFSSAQTQQQNVFGNPTQSNLITSQNQPSNAFGMQQSNMFGNATQPNPSLFNYSQPSNFSTAGTYAASQFSTPTAFATAPSASPNAHAQQQSFMAGNTAVGNVPNPFMHSGYAAPHIQSQNPGNPFMMQQQQQGSTPFAAPNVTNPFMSNTSNPAQPQMSTNPFF